MSKNNLSKGNRIIWDSNFGYDIGIFISNKGVKYNTVTVELTTGLVTGEVSLPPYEIHPYTAKKINKLEKTYGYRKEFSKIF